MNPISSRSKKRVKRTRMDDENENQLAENLAQRYVDMEFIKKLACIEDVTKAFPQIIALAADQKITVYEMNEFIRALKDYARHLKEYEIMDRYFKDLEQFKTLYTDLAEAKKFDIKELKNI